MKIIGCEVWPVELTLAEPFTIAYMTTDKAINYFLRIDTDDGISGFGCSAFDEEVTGENEKSVGAALGDIAVPMLLGEDPLNYAAILSRLHSLLIDQPTAMASVDMALMDIVGKKAGLPLYKLFGGAKSSMVTSITLGIQPVLQVVEKARMWVGKGFKALKVKGGLSVEDDMEKLRRIREAVGHDILLYFDANQGYSMNDALLCMDTLAKVKAEFIEQPCDKKELGQFHQLRNLSQSHMPVMADEAVLGPEDALKVIAAGGANLFNIKLAKTGGIWRAMKLDAVAHAHGASTMVGCMDEAGLGIAAGLHVALSSTNVKYADLDGHVEFIDDPSYDAVKIIDGRIYPNDGPGLGFSL
jgi:L-alanine-DL-glutamate epimerase-like enolase superfamily enzyme